MNYSEEFIQRVLLDAPSGSPFSLKRSYNLLTIFNLSWGFFRYGEADIITVDNKYKLIEGEIKCSYRDFLNDDKKNPKIMEERKKKLECKYYILPLDVYKQYENEIFQKVCQRKCGLVVVNGIYCNTIFPAPPFENDYTINLNQFFKLAKLACYRQHGCINENELNFKFIEEENETSKNTIK